MYICTGIKLTLLKTKDNHFQDSGDHDDPTSFRNKIIGVALAFASALLQLVNNSILKKMKLNYTEALFTRSIFQIFVSFMIVFYKRKNFWIWEVDMKQNIDKIRFLFVFVTLLCGVVSISDLIAVTYMPIGDAMTIILCGAVPTAILAAIFLDERFRLWKLVCSLLVVSGIIMVIRPPFIFGNDKDTDIFRNLTETKNNTSFNTNKSYAKDYYYIGALAAFTFMLSDAISRIIMKILLQNKSTKSSALFLFYHGFLCVGISFMMPLIDGDQRNLFPAENVAQYDSSAWICLSIFAIIGVATFYTRWKALQLVGPVILGFIRTSEIVISYVTEIVLFDTLPYLSSMFGAIFITGACIGILLENILLKYLPAKIQPMF